MVSGVHPLPTDRQYTTVFSSKVGSEHVASNSRIFKYVVQECRISEQACYLY